MYYAQICQQLIDKKLVIAVPSGNYGNLTAGLVAWKMGLPIHRFIAASNINKIVPDYLASARYIPRESVSTYSNAMDVGAPSNFVRMLELFGGKHAQMIKMISGFHLTDEQTLNAMRACFEKTHYLPDPHGVIAYESLQDQLGEDETGVFLETAHPVKFQNVVDKILDEPLSFQEKKKDLMARSTEMKVIPNEFHALESALVH